MKTTVAMPEGKRGGGEVESKIFGGGCKESFIEIDSRIFESKLKISARNNEFLNCKLSLAVI